MLQYKLYYWDVPFRGIFPQMFLEEVEASYEFHDASEIYPDKSLKIHNPGMAPPYLFDVKNEKYLTQMPAIMVHLAREYDDYLPKRTETFDLALKTIMDCHDVLLEITNSYGKEMWKPKSWREFRRERLVRWMEIFELTGRAHGLKHNGEGFLLGTSISVADIATTALFGTMIYSFPELEDDLRKFAPRILELCQRIEARPMIRPFLRKERREKGNVYCGGEIEKSIRKMLKTESDAEKKSVA